MQSISVLITREVAPVAEEMLRKQFFVDVNRESRFLSENELIEAAKTYDAILTMIPDRINRKVIDSAAKLKVISNLAVGLDNVDYMYAKEKKIAVYNLPDTVTNSTADLTFALLLSLLRKVPQAQAFVRENKWKGWEPGLFLGEELNGKTLGIIGYGKIGRAVARRAIGFGLKVLFHNRNPVEEANPHIHPAGLEEIYACSDYIALHIPLNEATRGLINEGAFKRMQKKPVIINMARGPVVVTKDLLKALEEGQIRGAALDVTDPEPLEGSHPLCHLPNCLVIPHIGSATIECRTEMAKRAAENILNHFNGIL